MSANHQNQIIATGSRDQVEDDSENFLVRKLWVRAQLRELARKGKLGRCVSPDPVAVDTVVARSSSNAHIRDGQVDPAAPVTAPQAAARARHSQTQPSDRVLGNAMVSCGPPFEATRQVIR